MSYRFDGALATIDDPAFFRTWIDDEAYVERLTRSEHPTDAARRLVAVEFQRELARMVARGQVAKEIDELLERFISDDYQQHDPHLADGREPLAAFFKDASAAGIDLWPPMPVCVMNDGDVVSLLLQGPPEQGSKFIPTMFRVTDGRMSEHWSAAAPPPPAPSADTTQDRMRND